LRLTYCTVACYTNFSYTNIMAKIRILLGCKSSLFILFAGVSHCSQKWTKIVLIKGFSPLFSL
jgi:hypothetical protein